MLNVAGEIFRQLVQSLLDGLGGLQGIGTGCELHSRSHTFVAILARGKAVVELAHLETSHIRQIHHRAIGLGVQHDLAELLGRAQRALDRDGRAQLLI